MCDNSSFFFFSSQAGSVMLIIAKKFLYLRSSYLCLISFVSKKQQNGIQRFYLCLIVDAIDALNSSQKSNRVLTVINALILIKKLTY